jgi:hypothetical protein
MNDKYLYAMLSTYGECWTVTDGGTEKVDGLPSLMRQGWRPVRETPFVQHTGQSYILIVLERE